MSAKKLICIMMLAALGLSGCARQGLIAQREGMGLLANLPALKSYQAYRQSSADPSGGNADGRQDLPILPGETRTIAQIKGAGAITHIWVTIASMDPAHLKNLVLRMHWDGEKYPSVEAPIGDFFGQGNNKYYQYSSLPFQIGTLKGLNCFWRMPFRKGARVTVTNDGPVKCDAFYYYVDYRKFHPFAMRGEGRFHAQYLQAFPCKAGENYLILETKGRGHYVGCNLSIHQNASGWWGEGDDMITIDGDKKPRLLGTGSEDYFCGAWCYGLAFSNLYFGCPLRGEMRSGAYWNVYRYHIEDPIPFRKSIKVAIEHGHQNDRSDNFSSVAYWYQTEPHVPFAQLPAPKDRISVAPPVFAEKGVSEMENLIEGFKGGPLAKQDMGAYGGFWSEDGQLFFTAPGPLTYARPFKVAPENACETKMELWYTQAPDYGICEFWFNGVKTAGWDGYNPQVKRSKAEFPLTLKAGENIMELRITGKNPASQGCQAGLDCFRLSQR